MAAKPKLTPEQWAEARAKWEADERKGWPWLIEEMGLNVSGEAIRLRAKAEGWAKVGGPKLAKAPSLDATLVREVTVKMHKLQGGLKPAEIDEPAPKGPCELAEAGPLDAVGPALEPAPESFIIEALAELKPKEITFCEAYLTCFNGTKAYQAAYPDASYATAGSKSCILLARPHVERYIAKRLKQAFERTEEAQDKLLSYYMAAAYGDVNELVEYRREACRYCHGDDHQYQYTPAEWLRVQKEAESEGEEADLLGGTGFDPRKDPHPDCPECHGEGKGRVVFKDTRTLSPAGRALYAGVKIGKDGIEVKINSQERARDMLAKILKLTEDKTEINVVQLDIGSLESKFAKKMREAHERQQQVLLERGISGGE